MSKTMPLFLFVAEMWENIFLWWHTQVEKWVESCTSYLRRLHFVWSGFNLSISHFTIGGFSPVSGRSKRRRSDDRCLEILNFRPCTSKFKELVVHTPPQVVNHTISMPTTILVPHFPHRFLSFWILILAIFSKKARWQNRSIATTKNRRTPKKREGTETMGIYRRARIKWQKKWLLRDLNTRVRIHYGLNVAPFMEKKGIIWLAICILKTISGISTHLDRSVKKSINRFLPIEQSGLLKGIYSEILPIPYLYNIFWKLTFTFITLLASPR